jgi:hypothetical protein
MFNDPSAIAFSISPTPRGFDFILVTCGIPLFAFASSCPSQNAMSSSTVTVGPGMKTFAIRSLNASTKDLTDHHL